MGDEWCLEGTLLNIRTRSSTLIICAVSRQANGEGRIQGMVGFVYVSRRYPSGDGIARCAPRLKRNHLGRNRRHFSLTSSIR